MNNQSLEVDDEVWDFINFDKPRDFLIYFPHNNLGSFDFVVKLEYEDDNNEEEIQGGKLDDDLFTDNKGKN